MTAPRSPQIMRPVGLVSESRSVTRPLCPQVIFLHHPFCICYMYTLYVAFCRCQHIIETGSIIRSAITPPALCDELHRRTPPVCVSPSHKVAQEVFSAAMIFFNVLMSDRALSPLPYFLQFACHLFVVHPPSSQSTVEWEEVRFIDAGTIGHTSYQDSRSIA